MLFFYFKANIFALAKPTSKLFSLSPKLGVALRTNSIELTEALSLQTEGGL